MPQHARLNHLAKSEDASSPAIRWALALAGIILLCGIVGGVYARGLNAPFIFDDLDSVVDNASIVRLWPLWGTAAHPGPLNPPPYSSTSARPLVNLSLAINYYFGQIDPFGYHIFNLIAHLLSAMVLWAIVSRTLRLKYFSGNFDRAAGLLGFAVAIVWVLHPLTTESVQYITQRSELMYALFYFITIYCALRYWIAA